MADRSLRDAKTGEFKGSRSESQSGGKGAKSKQSKSKGVIVMPKRKVTNKVLKGSGKIGGGDNHFEIHPPNDGGGIRGQAGRITRG